MDWDSNANLECVKGR